MSTGLKKITIHDLLGSHPLLGQITHHPHVWENTPRGSASKSSAYLTAQDPMTDFKSLPLSFCSAFVALSCWLSVELKCFFPPICSLISLKTKLILCIMEKKRKPVCGAGAMAENTTHCGIFELSLWSHKSANASCWTGASRACFNCSQRKRWMVKEQQILCKGDYSNLNTKYWQL